MYVITVYIAGSGPVQHIDSKDTMLFVTDHSIYFVQMVATILGEGVIIFIMFQSLCQQNYTHVLYYI
jgi:hypothetical protein